MEAPESREDDEHPLSRPRAPATNRPRTASEDPVGGWRQRLLRWILWAYVGLGAVAAAAGIGLAVIEGVWGIVAVDVGAWLTAVALALLPGRYHALKIGGALAITYGIGVFFTLSFGPFAAGPLWLFATPMMTGALIGWRAAVGALGVLTATLIGTGVLLDRGVIAWPHEIGLGEWVVISGSLLALSGMISVSVALLLEGIERAHRAREVEAQARERLEEQLRNAQKMEAVGRLAGGIAHDFNNLMLAVMGFTELAMDNLEEDAPSLDDLREIAKAVDRGRGLTSQLLAFSRQNVATPRTIDLNGFIREADRLLEQFAGDQVRVEVRLSPTPCWVRIDPDALSQIFVNATVNARDAMPEGGVLRIATANMSISDDSQPEEALQLLPGDYARVTVSDNGVGIPADDLDKIFEPFFTTKNPGQGTGLGLSTCWAIAEQAGGRLRVESKPGRGTTLELLLPTASAASDAKPDPSAPASGGGDETILVVEDEEQVRQTFTRILRSNGYEVIETKDAEQALSIIRASGNRIDLLLTDIIMPGVNGRELASRAQEIRPGLPTLFVSGYSGEALAERDLIADGVALLKKPFSLKELSARVREILDAHK